MMETRPAPLTLFNDTQQDKLEHKVLLVPEVVELARVLMPELLNPSEQPTQLLDRIYRYLFEQKKLKEPLLEKELPPAFYTALYGLKSMIKEHGLTKARLILENSKKRFAAFLDEEMNG